MGKLKIKKSDVWIDMTPMSDVMVLLLTFFMLTSTFVKNEPVKVNQPQSISEIDIPEMSLLTIHVDTLGQVFMSTTDQKAQEKALTKMLGLHNMNLSTDLVAKFKIDPMWGTSMKALKGYLESEDLAAAMKESTGIKLEGEVLSDSINHVVAKKSEFQEWVESTKSAYADIMDESALSDDEKSQRKMKIAIKADAHAPYGKIKEVLNQLQDIHESRYFLITSLKKGMEE